MDVALHFGGRAVCPEAFHNAKGNRYCTGIAPDRYQNAGLVSQFDPQAALENPSCQSMYDRILPYCFPLDCLLQAIANDCLGIGFAALQGLPDTPFVQSLFPVHLCRIRLNPRHDLVRRFSR
jgi:hypothetical protein